MIIPQIDGLDLAALDLDPKMPNAIHDVSDSSIIELTAGPVSDIHLIRVDDDEYLLKMGPAVLRFEIDDRLVARIEISSRSEQRDELLTYEDEEDDDEDYGDEEGV